MAFPSGLTLSAPARRARWGALVASVVLVFGVGCTGKIERPADGSAAGNGAGAEPGGGPQPGSGTGGGGVGGTSDAGTSGEGGGGASTTGGTGASGGSAPLDCTSSTHGATAPTRRLTLEEYRNAVSDLLGITPGERYPAGSGNPVTGYSTEPDLLLVSEQGVGSIMTAAEEVALALAPKLESVLACASRGDDGCATTYLDTIGRRAFRRPLTDDERSSLLEMYAAERDDGASFSDAVGVMTAAMLQMPQFLYVLEGDVAAGEDRLRTGPELATRLALQLWGSIPDAELLDAAEGQKLTNAAEVRAQAERLLRDPRSDRAIRRFFREWSETSAIAVASKDRSAFDYLDDALTEDLNESFDRFVTDQVRSEGTLYSLLRSNRMFVRDKLADFFGLDPVDVWTAVALPSDVYTGISTQPALLAALSHTVSPSYVFRGRFIMKRLLCVDLGVPPADAQSEFGSLTLPPDPTGKETALVVEAKPSCGGCHKLLDPGGLAYEHFDGLGHFRDTYDSGKVIDTNGTLIGVTDEPIEFEGPADLMEKLAALPETSRCFATQLFRATASRLNGAEDSCSIQTIADAMRRSGGTLASAFIESTQTDQFLYRRGE